MENKALLLERTWAELESKGHSRGSGKLPSDFLGARKRNLKALFDALPQDQQDEWVRLSVEAQEEEKLRASDAGVVQECVPESETMMPQTDADSGVKRSSRVSFRNTSIRSFDRAASGKRLPWSSWAHTSASKTDKCTPSRALLLSGQDQSD